MKHRKRLCSYCGRPPATTADHVIPSSLYPDSKAASNVPRITVPACVPCNSSWTDDEPHFKAMLAIAGEANSAVQELWGSSIERSFQQVDGLRRLTDIFQQMEPVIVDGQRRYKVYPARDPRVMRIVRKVIRGLSHFHKIETAVSDDRVWADIEKYQISQRLIDGVRRHHREHDIIEYGFEPVKGDDGNIWTAWVLTFFERRTFVGLVLPRGSTYLPSSGS